MGRDWYKTAIWLAWLALPTTMLNYWRAWDRLPARIAVHFDASWQPNGWTSREGALLFALLVTTSMLIVSTIACFTVRASKPGSAWPVLIVFYIALSTCWLVNNWIVDRNLTNPPAQSDVVSPMQAHAQSTGEILFEKDRYEKDRYGSMREVRWLL